MRSIRWYYKTFLPLRVNAVRKHYEGKLMNIFMRKFIFEAYNVMPARLTDFQTHGFNSIGKPLCLIFKKQDNACRVGCFFVKLNLVENKMLQSVFFLREKRQTEN